MSTTSTSGEYIPHITASFITIGSAIFGFGFTTGSHAIEAVSSLIGAAFFGLGVFTDVKTKNTKIEKLQEDVSIVGKKIVPYESKIETTAETVATKA